MILEFSVANFLSFKDKVTFSMLANATNGLDDNYIISNDRRVLKTNAIYGANASGKTNLFKILTIVISMLRSSNIVNINNQQLKTSQLFTDYIETPRLHIPLGNEQVITADILNPTRTSTYLHYDDPIPTEMFTRVIMTLNAN